MNLRTITLLGLSGLQLLAAGCKADEDSSAGTVSAAEVSDCEETCAFEIECGVLTISRDACEEMCTLSLAYSSCFSDLLPEACRTAMASSSAYAECIAGLDTCDEYLAYQTGVASGEADFPCRNEWAAVQAACDDWAFMDDETLAQSCGDELNAMVEYLQSNSETLDTDTTE